MIGFLGIRSFFPQNQSVAGNVNQEIKIVTDFRYHITYIPHHTFLLLLFYELVYCAFHFISDDRSQGRTSVSHGQSLPSS